MAFPVDDLQYAALSDFYRLAGPGLDADVPKLYQQQPGITVFNVWDVLLHGVGNQFCHLLGRWIVFA